MKTFLVSFSRSSYFPIFIYLAISLFILADLLQPGYILTLDMVFAPNVKWINMFYGLEGPWISELPLVVLLDLGSHIIPVWIEQKIILLIIFCLSGASAFFLCPAQSKAGRYFAGFLYMLNPFVYVRVMAGQWKILLAYAFLPLAVKLMIDFYESPSLLNCLKVACVILIIGIISVPIMTLALGVLFLFFIFKILSIRRDGVAITRLILGLIVILGAVLLCSVYWIGPVITSGSNLLTQINPSDTVTFSAKTWGSDLSAIFNVATMHGFWRAGYTYIWDVFSGWYLLFFAILFLAVVGSVQFWRHDKVGTYVKSLSCMWFIAVILAVGASSSQLSLLYEFLFEEFIVFRGFRDSHKFVALVCLAYSYLGGLAIGHIVGSFQSRWMPILTRKAKVVAGAMLITVLAIPFLYSANMIGGEYGRLEAQDYPRGWYEVNDYLSSQEGDFDVLFLPWQGYINFSWLDSSIANPANLFFDSPIIRGEDINVIGIKTQSTNPIHPYIDFLLENKTDVDDLGSWLSPLNIKYVIVAKHGNEAPLDFLDHQGDLAKVLETDTLTLFRNENIVTKFSYTDLAFKIDGLSDPNLRDAVGQIPADYIKISPIQYEINMPDNCNLERCRYLLTSIPYSNSWSAGDYKHLSQFHGINVFDVSKDEVTIYFERFKLLKIFYLISSLSIAMLFLAMIFCIYKKKQNLRRS